MESGELDQLATEIDAATGAGDLESLEKSATKIDSIIEAVTASSHRSRLFFYQANCYSAIRHLNGESQSWSWESRLLEKEIFCLRSAQLDAGEEDPAAGRSTDLASRISTNLANAFSHVGRICEAIGGWDGVLESSPGYGMSLANRAHGFSSYARFLYDGGHQRVFLHESWLGTKHALAVGVEAHAVSDLESWIEKLEKLADWPSYNFQPKPESRGKTKMEREYRTWCVNNRLFLNPLNDLWRKDIVANDILTFPSVSVMFDDAHSAAPPEVFGIYNQLKQEYVSARFVIFEAMQESGRRLHYSDRRVILYDMLDYRVYRLWVEKLKMAFLSAHAIFDKIAFLINKYWKIGLNPRRISFKSVWKQRGDSRKGLASVFENSANWMLRGLYWLSKDFSEPSEEFSLLEPDAWHVSQIRNHIAHKYLRVYDDCLVDAAQMRESNGREWSYAVSTDELIERTLHLLQLARSALIYVSLAAHFEEHRRSLSRGEGVTMPMHLFEIAENGRL